MELFTLGVGYYTEADVYAAARVFTGWNLAGRGRSDRRHGQYAFFYNAEQHDTSAKTFSFPIYRTAAARSLPGRPRRACRTGSI